MVIQEIDNEVELVTGFFWFFTQEEMIEHEGKKLTVKLEIDTTKWLPKSADAAYRWYMYSPNAAGIRSKQGLLTICKVSNSPYEGTARHLDGEPLPDDWLYTELIDISDRVQMEPEYDGVVVEGPVSAEFVITPREDYTLHEITKQISTIHHGMMSPEEIDLLSADRIIRHAEVYETPRKTKTTLLSIPRPIHGGVADLRLGTPSDDEACFTCGHTANINGKKTYTCPGHFGRINLAVPVPNYMYLTGGVDSSPLLKTLKYVCLSCHEIVLPDEILNPLIENAKKIMYENKFTSPDGFALIWKAIGDAYNAYYKEAKNPANWGAYQLSQGGPVPTPLSTKVNHCPRCNEKSPILRFSMKFGMGRRAEFSPKPGDRPRDEFPISRPYSYGEVHKALAGVPNGQALALGYNTKIDPSIGVPVSHPRYLFWERFPIAPNNVRPPREVPGSGIEMNDLNKLYINVVRANQTLLDLADDTQKSRRSESILFKACTQALSTQTPFGTPAMTKKFGGDSAVNAALEGMYDRIKPPGKTKNHIRRINQSKVTEHTLYSVITPNPDLRLDEVGIPISACIRMTVAERVTKDNIEELREAVIRGHPYEKRGTAALDKWDIEKYFGGAKAIQTFKPSKHIISLEGRPNSVKDPFAVDSKDGWEFPEAQHTWEREILSGIEARYAGVEDKSGMEDEIKRARREYRYEFASNNRRGLADNLKLGDIVHRSLRRNDMIMFTRAPALHRQNVMAARVVPLDQKAISFNPTICVPFNADYDGDTMRCFVPQSPEAIQECKDILDVNKQIIHSRYGRPTIASDQDETSGAYLLTFPNKSKLTYKGKDEDGNDTTITYNAYQKLDDDKKKKFKGPHGTFDGRIGYDKDGYVYFTRKALIEMLGLVYTRDDEGNVKYLTELPEPDLQNKYYTGKSVVSMFIPEGINCDWKDSTGEDVSIRNGVLRHGTLDAKGVKNGSMVLGAAFVYHFDYELGIRKLAEFIDHVNRLFFAAHLYVGYTIGIEDVSLKEPEFIEKKNQLYNEANEKIRILTEAFFNKKLEKLDDSYFKEHSRHWLTYDPLGWMELQIAEITGKFDKEITKLTKELQGTANQMNIAVVSGARAKNLNIQQMSGAYGQVAVGGTRLLSGIKVGRLLSHYKKGDYSGEAFAFSPDSYAEGFRPEHYFLGSIAGRRSMMESSMGAIQKSGYLSHRLKRASENLMIDDRGYLVNLRLGKVLSTEVGEDGLQPFHARGPDNPNGLSLELQPHFISQLCKHGISLYDNCDTCQIGTEHSLRGKAGRLPLNILSKLTKKLETREIEDPLSYFSRAYEYYLESKASPGEMIGAAAGANVGEPVTQAGLRAFHGGGKGSMPTTDRIVQLLDLSRSAIKQPATRFFLKEEYNNEETAKKLANFCSTLLLDDIVKVFRYLSEERAIDLEYDMSVVDTFELDLEFIYEYLSYKGNNERPKFSVNKTPEGLRIRTEGVPSVIDSDAYLLILKESLGKYQINGLISGGRAFADKAQHPTKEKPSWCVFVKGPVKPTPGRPNPMMENAYELIGEYYDEYLTVSNDPFWIAHEYGLEAALSGIKELFNEQMNDPINDRGLGEIDLRYIDAMIDNMGSTGYLSGLGKSGHMVSNSISLLGGIGGEDPGKSLRAHSIMGTADNLEGMVEAITAGKDLEIGKRYIERKSSNE